ncbi:MAG: hypothetical protein Q9157_000567 [Trypethelium eluteriae]
MSGNSSSGNANLARVRDNQRRSRARRKEYLAELENKIRTCQQLGVQATAEVQAVARRVLDENKRLRALLREKGATQWEIDGYIGTQSTDNNMPKEEVSQFSGAPVILEDLLSHRRPCQLGDEADSCSPSRKCSLNSNPDSQFTVAPQASFVSDTAQSMPFHSRSSTSTSRNASPSAQTARCSGLPKSDQVPMGSFEYNAIVPQLEHFQQLQRSRYNASLWQSQLQSVASAPLTDSTAYMTNGITQQDLPYPADTCTHTDAASGVYSIFNAGDEKIDAEYRYHSGEDCKVGSELMFQMINCHPEEHVGYGKFR